MNLINSKKNSDSKTDENNSEKLITSLDDDYFSDNEKDIKENIKNANFENLYQIFEIQLNEDFFNSEKKEIPDKIIKIPSKVHIPYKKSIFAPSNKNLEYENTKNEKSENKSKNNSKIIKTNYLLSNSSKINSNSVNYSKESENFIKKKACENSVISHEDVNYIKKKKLIEKEKQDFSKSNSFISESEDSKINSKKDILFNVKKIKSSSCKKRKNKFNTFNQISNLKKNISERDISNLSRANSLMIDSKVKNGNFCFLCDEDFFPNNIVVKFYLCDDIFHKICLDKFLEDNGGYNIICPKCKKVIFK